MNVGKWFLGGLAGGLVGAAIWAGIVYLTHVEIGWVAWGVGALVGVGVRLAAREDVGPKPALVAAVIAIATVYAAKYLTVYLLLSGFGSDVKIEPEDVIGELAHQVAGERVAKKQRVNWPAGVTLETAGTRQDFPPDVWNEASARWAKLGPAEQQQRMAARKKEMEAIFGAVRGSILGEAFKASFGPFDLLWFFLATATAYRIGSGMASERG